MSEGHATDEGKPVCQSDNDLGGALRELAFAVRHDLFVPRSRGKAGKPNEPGPGLDEDSMGYGCDARKILEEIR